MLRKKLSNHFYQRANVPGIARELIGKVLVSRLDGITCAGRIVEVEAYNGITDKASHARGGRRTARTEIMYAKGGVAYVYLCYGIHHLFNVVTNTSGIPDAILIRALEPLEGIREMLRRTGKKKADETLTRGPGNAARAMGISTAHTGWSLQSPELFIAADNYVVNDQDIVAGPRIGVDYAGSDALQPYRFYIKGNKYVSMPNKS
jgi:DNA-3-methyladenine glycosylase